MKKPITMTRAALCDDLAERLLNGRTLTQNELSVVCAQSGGHEPSRVLDALRNKRGLPIQTTTSGSYATRTYSINRTDCKSYRANPEATAEAWKSAAAERAIDRKLHRVWVTLGLLAKHRTGALRAILEYHEVRF